MPAKFSSEDQERALARLRANHWDVRRTADELGISRQTLYNWKHLDNSGESNLSKLPNLSNLSTIQPSSAPLATTDAELLNRLYRLEDRLMQMTEDICATLPELLTEANVNQRVSAMTQMIDRVLKMAALLPPRDQDEPPQDPALQIFPPDLLEILDTRPDDREDADERDDGYNQPNQKGDPYGSP
jgi:transposase-like protein